jgi:hypothetical protein
MTVHTRSKGHSATAAAAYRAADRIHDERTGETHDYTRKGRVLHAQIVVPDDAPDWAKDREQLWNAAERAELRKNSCIARDVVVSLPVELTAEQRKALALTFAGEVARRHHCAVDVALHRPERGGDERNFHAHLLCSTRRLGPTGFTEKTRELDERRSGEVEYWRDRWERLQNERLKYYGHSARVDHRSLKAQGIDREPTHHRGPAISGILARGERSDVMERIQQETAERLLLAKELGALERQGRELQSRIIDLSGDLAKALRERDSAQHARALTLEEQRAQSRENWQAYRQAQERSDEKSKTPTQNHAPELNLDTTAKDNREAGQQRTLPDHHFGP